MVIWIHCLPRKGVVSTTLSPCAIISGQTLQYPQHLRSEFVSCFQTYEYNQPTNSIKDRILGAICLVATGNDQVTCRFCSLCTGKVVTRTHCILLSMTPGLMQRFIKIKLELKANIGQHFLTDHFGADLSCWCQHYRSVWWINSIISIKWIIMRWW